MSVKQRNIGKPSFQTSLRIFRDDLVKQIRLRATEAIIDAVQLEGQDHSFKISMECTWKNRHGMHDYVIRRLINHSLGMQKNFYFLPGTKIKVQLTTLDAIRHCYLSLPRPEKSQRWLHHSLLCSKAHDMPITKFVEELSKTVKKEENNLLDCKTLEEFKNDARSKQTLLYSITEVLLTKCSGDLQRAPQDKDPDVGTAAVAAPKPTDAESTTTRDAVTGPGPGAVRQRAMSPSSAQEPRSGLLIDHFGDLGREYRASLDSKASKVHDSVKARSERKYDGLPTSSGDVSNWVIRARQAALEEVRKEYQNSCASTHFEKGLLIKNPFMTACHCCRKPADGVAGFSHAVSSGCGSVSGTVAEGRGASQSPVLDGGRSGDGVGQAAEALPSAGDLLG